MRIWKDEADYDPIHKKVNRDSVKQTRDDRLLRQKFDLPTGDVKHGCDHERDKKMNQQTQPSCPKAALKRARTEKTAGDSLQHPNRSGALDSRDHKRRRDIQNSSD